MTLGIVHTPWYDVHGRKYIDMSIDGILYNVKIPFRYNRVMCYVEGIVPIQEFQSGDIVDCLIRRGVLYSIRRQPSPRSQPEDEYQRDQAKDP